MKKKWQHMRINKRFLQNCRDGFGLRAFTLYEAYCLYALRHMKKPREGVFERERSAEDTWLGMNVRNNLCAATYRGLLTRVRPGVYKFEV